MQKRLLPQTPWQAKTLWSLEWKPLAMLVLGLTLFGVGEGLLVLSQLGVTPWTTLSQGLARQSGWDIGWMTFLISCVVMVLWLPLHLRVGLGTVANMVVIALVLGLMVRWVPVPVSDWGRWLCCVGGVWLVGVASALYLTCHMGAGPRDGLMVGLCARTGWRIGWVRCGIEGTVCLVGWLLGGTVGVGTLLFAVGVGWVVQGGLAVLRWRFG